MSRAAMGDDPTDLLYQHTVLCQTCLPYRDPGDDKRQWERKNGYAHLKVLAGEAMHPDTRELVPIGLPFGPKPRLVLSHLNAEALRMGNPEIEVEDSLTAFVKRIGLPTDGRSIGVVKDQLARLSAASVRLGVMLSDEHTTTLTMPIVSRFDLWFPKDARQRVLWPSKVKLGAEYFESLQQHAVPLHPEALRALSQSAMGLDIYAWLAQRLHRIKPGSSQFITWKALKEQFGWHYDSIRKFRQVFKTALIQVTVEYRAAKINLDERGITLHHSPPPVLCRYSPVVRDGKPKGTATSLTAT